MRTIRQQLLLWLFGGAFFCSIIAGGALFLKIREEASELFDAQLKQVAGSLPVPIAAGSNDNIDGGPEEKVVLQAWDSKGHSVYSSDPESILPLYPALGFKTVTIGDEQWRVYSRTKQNLMIQVAQPTLVRQTLAARIAFRCLLPFLILIPILAYFIWIAVGRSLLPLTQFAYAVKSRSPDALQPLSLDGLSPEVVPVGEALNDLLKRLDIALTTQRAFIADAAHELRTPIAALKLQLQLVERAVGEDQRLIAFNKLHERLDRTSHLVHQLLTLARHEPGREQQLFHDLSLQKLAEKVVVDYYPLAATKNIEFGMEFDPLTPSIRGNMDDLNILLNNIVDNALRYTPVGGRVDISVKYQNNKSIIRVVDNGPGISPEDRSRVFDRFYRCDGVEPWGSGLGLAIAKSIADMHSARIEFDNNPLEQGLVATIIFS